MESVTVLKVVLQCFDPYVICNNNDSFSGFGVDLWNEVLKNSYNGSYSTEFTVARSYEEYFSILQNNEASFGIRGLAASDLDNQLFQRTVSYHDTLVRVAILKQEQRDVVRAIRDVLSSKIIYDEIAILLLGVILMSNIVWFIEKRKNYVQFDRFYPKGAFDGMYWALTTVTTIGYSNSVPQSKIGRAIALFWMLSSYFTLVVIAGTVGALLTVDELQTPPVHLTDLQGESVAVVKYSQGFEIARRYSSKIYPLENYYEAVELMKNNTVTFCLGEQTSLKILNETSFETILSGASFANAFFSYSIAPSVDTTFTTRINKQILLSKLSSYYDELLDRYFRDTMESKVEEKEGFKKGYIFTTSAYSFILLYVLFILLMRIVKHNNYQPREQNKEQQEQTRPVPPN